MTSTNKLTPQPEGRAHYQHHLQLSLGQAYKRRQYWLDL